MLHHLRHTSLPFNLSRTAVLPIIIFIVIVIYWFCSLLGSALPHSHSNTLWLTQVTSFLLWCWFLCYNFSLLKLVQHSSPGSSVGRESACHAGDLGSIPGLGRSPGGGHGNPLQSSCLENPHTEEPGGRQSMGSQSQTRLKWLSMAWCGETTDGYVGVHSSSENLFWWSLCWWFLPDSVFPVMVAEWFSASNILST